MTDKTKVQQARTEWHQAQAELQKVHDFFQKLEDERRQLAIDFTAASIPRLVEIDNFLSRRSEYTHMLKSKIDDARDRAQFFERQELSKNKRVSGVT